MINQAMMLLEEVEEVAPGDLRAQVGLLIRLNGVLLEASKALSDDIEVLHDRLQKLENKLNQ